MTRRIMPLLWCHLALISAKLLFVSGLFMSAKVCSEFRQKTPCLSLFTFRNYWVSGLSSKGPNYYLFLINISMNLKTNLK